MSSSHYNKWLLEEEAKHESAKRYVSRKAIVAGNKLRHRFDFYGGRRPHIEVLPHTPDGGHPWTVTVHMHRDNAPRVFLGADKIEEFPSDVMLTRLMLIS